MMRRNVRAAALVAAMLVMGVRAARAQDDAPTDRDFFDDARLHTIRLTINPRDWDDLRANFQLNTYYACHFEWSGQRALNVGIRSRGTGSRSGSKPGLRVDFNVFDEAQHFLGLKSVVLRNNVQDPSGLHERLGMTLFARMGLPAPRQAHARLYVNNDYVGLYSIVEAVDKRFLAAHYGQSDGHLYEYDYDPADEPYRFEFRGPNPSLYSPKPFKPVTHELDPDPQPLAAMIQAVTDSRQSEFVERLSRYLDLERLVTHVAVESFLSETDGFVGDWGMNNFYLYRFEGSTQSTVIPWDKSEAFKGGVERSIWHNVDDVPSWLQNLLITKAMRVHELRARFLETLQRCADVVSAPIPTDPDDPPAPEMGWLEAETRRAYLQVRDAAWDDPVKPYSNDEFEEAVEALVEFARRRSDVVRREIQRSPR